MHVRDALVIDQKIVSFASAKCDDSVSRHADYFYVFSFGHAQHFKYNVGDISRSLDLKYIVFVSVIVDLVWVFGIAELAGTNFIDRGQAIILVVVDTAASKPLLQAL